MLLRIEPCKNWLIFYCFTRALTTKGLTKAQDNYLNHTHYL